MSTYQYYEFQALDKPLTDEEQQAVAALSSRVHPHPRHAIFTYSWSGFRGDPEQILARYYDAMLYMASWGSRQLMFRFPRGVLDVESIRPYTQPPIIQDYVSFSRAGDYIVLNIEFHPEEGRSYWIEAEGTFAPMLSLRDDLVHGDYRALYLAWLHAVEWEDMLDSVVEPPVPPGMSSLTRGLEAFIEFFEIDDTLVRVAAGASHEPAAPPVGWLESALARLSSEERTEFLRRLAEGELLLSAKFNRRLRELAPWTEPERAERRTVGQLLREAEDRREQARRQRAAEAEARRIAGLEALSAREVEAWAEVEALIERMQARPYDEAVALLVKLRELAVYQEKEAQFQRRVNDIRQRYHRRPALMDRLKRAGLGSA